MKLFDEAQITDFSRENAPINAKKMLELALKLEPIDKEESERAFRLAEIFENVEQN